MAYIGEIRMFAGGTLPNGWAWCDGTALPIQGNETLAALLGTTFGYDSQTTVKLPDFRSRTMVHSAPGFVQAGTYYGFETVAIQPGVVPNHTHTGLGKASAQNSTAPAGAVPGIAGSNVYSDGSPNCSLVRTTISVAGQSTAHNNVQPYCTVNFIICIAGGIAPVTGSATGGSFSSFGGSLLLCAFNSIVPAHYVRPDSSELSRSTFSGLFGLMGTTFGVGDGSTTFNLPDLRGVAICGVGTASDTLSAAITSTGATAISVTSGARILSGTVITIDTEKMLVTAGGTTTSLTVTRAYAGTTAATHSNGATVKVLSTYALGDLVGEVAHIVSAAELPPHQHDFTAVSESGNLSSPANNWLAGSAMFRTGAGADAFAPQHIYEVGPASPAPNIPHENRQPFAGITALLAADDVTPDANTGDLRVWFGSSAPSGWAACDGAALNTTTDATLFGVISYAFGGSGSSFNVPDFRGRVPVGAGQATGLASYALGQYGGEEKHILTVAEMPAHSHPVYADGSMADQTSPFVALLGTASNMYRATGTPVLLDASAVQPTGSGTGHENRMPTMAWMLIIKK